MYVFRFFWVTSEVEVYVVDLFFVWFREYLEKNYFLDIGWILFLGSGYF